MPNVKLILEYNGARFKGWQAQAKGRTIELELERVLEVVLRTKIHPVYASGRTDAGVHARGQVVNLTVPEGVDLERLRHSISNILRGELAVLSAEFVPTEFHSRYDSDGKQYTYTILNRPAPPVLDKGRVWYISRPLDHVLMNREAQALIGEHDFTSLRGARCMSRTPVKRIFESEVTRSGDYIRYRVVGSGFLKQMVRIIVGTLVGLSKQTLKVATMTEVLNAKNRSIAGVTAPAHGLCLDWVRYPESSI